MNNDPFNWVDEREEEMKEERAKSYFDIKEGNQQFILLSYCAPLARVFDPATKKYRAAQEGDKGVSVKGVCWVLQDGLIKQAKLPYTVVKAIRSIQQNPDWEFTFPFPHTLTLNAENAGSKEVKYSLTASPKRVDIPKEVLDELKKKPSPDAIVERLKGGKLPTSIEDTRDAPADYPEIEEIDQF